MDNCLVVFMSGNHAVLVKEELKKQRISVSIEATPCSIAKEGCSYCIKVPKEHLEKVLNQVTACQVPIRDVYAIVFRKGKKKYEKI